MPPLPVVVEIGRCFAFSAKSVKYLLAPSGMSSSGTGSGIARPHTHSFGGRAQMHSKLSKLIEDMVRPSAARSLATESARNLFARSKSTRSTPAVRMIVYRVLILLFYTWYCTIHTYYL